MRVAALVLAVLLAGCTNQPASPEIRFLREVERFAQTPMNQMRPAVEAWLGMPLEADEFRARNARRVVDTPVFAGTIYVNTDFPHPASPGARYAIGALSFDAARPCVTPGGVRTVFGGRGRLVAFLATAPRAYEVDEGAFGYLVDQAAKRVIIFAFSGRRCAIGIRIVEGNTEDFDWVADAVTARAE